MGRAALRRSASAELAAQTVASQDTGRLRLTWSFRPAFQGRPEATESSKGDNQ